MGGWPSPDWPVITTKAATVKKLWLDNQLLVVFGDSVLPSSTPMGRPVHVE